MAEKYRILSLDGGSFALMSVLLLQEIEHQRPGFLSKIDMFAGTSSGAMTSLMLARDADPAQMLSRVEDYWHESPELLQSPFPGMLPGLFGVAPFFPNRRTIQALSQPELLGNLTLEQLAKAVTVVSFSVSPADSRVRSWHPKVFHNFGGAGEAGATVRAADVAMESSSFPVFDPIYHGSVDGGVYANNPSMVAISQLVESTRRSKDQEVAGTRRRRAATTRKLLPSTALTEAGADVDLSDLLVFSIGYEVSRRLNVWDGNWGYLQWVFNPQQPVALLNLFMDAGVEGIAFECRAMLPHGNYLRLSAHTDRPTRPQSIPEQPARVHRLARHDDNRKLVHEAVNWLDKSGWLD